MRYHNSDRNEEEVYFPIPIHAASAATLQHLHPQHPPPHHHQPQLHHHQHQQHQHHHRPSNKLRHSQSGVGVNGPKRSAIEAAVVPVIAAVDPSTYHYNYLVNSSPSSSSSPRGGGGGNQQQQQQQYQHYHHRKSSSGSASASPTKKSSAGGRVVVGSNRMASKVEYVHSDQLMAATYVKNSKAIGFLWGVFSVCYAIITLVVFIQPQWIGARSPASSGYFGLWKHCAVASVMTEMTTTSEFICRGRLDDFSSILNPAFRVATVFVGIAALVAILSVFGLILFICAPARQAYFIIAMMQTLAAICTGVGLVVFPAGFDAAEVKLTCGPQADRFYLGSCTVRWAYVLAIIGLLDGAVLAVLGFVLGSRHLKLSDEFSSGSTRKIHSISGLNGYPPRGGYFYGTDSGPTPSVSYSYASTKRSTMGGGLGGGLQPIVLLPPDTESEYRSKASLYRAEYATPKQNIQL